MKTGNRFGIVDKTKTLVACILCGVNLPKADKCIEQHANGTKHKECIETMALNGIYLNKDELFCKLCNTTLSEDIMTHVDCDSHANIIATIEELTDGNYINMEEYLSTKKEDVTCEVCKSTFNFNLLDVQEHINDVGHRSKLADTLKPLNAIFPVNDNEDELWCKVCEVYIENSSAGVLDHVFDYEDHVNWFEDMNDLLEDNHMSIDEFLTAEFHMKGYCHLCDVEMDCDHDAVEEHIMSDGHALLLE